jgi:predicted metal-dependent hydrolase
MRRVYEERCSPPVGQYTVSVPKTALREISVDGTALTLALERKRVKNVNARLRGATLSVSAPAGMPDAKLEPLVRELARRLLRRAHAARVNEEEDALALARKVAERFPKPPPSVDRVLFVTTQKARWGSYSPRTCTIRLNTALRRMPRWVLEAVVAHELAHAVHPNHSPAFWDLLRRVCPETDRAKAFLDGVSWLANNRERLLPVERELLGEIGREEDLRRD